MWSSLIDQYKKDLTEFVSTVKEDTEHVLSRAAERFADVKKSYNTEEKLLSLDRKPIEPTIARIIEDPDVLVDAIEPEDKEFEEFCKVFVVAECDDDIAAILDRAPDMQDVLSSFVPEKMTYAAFWARVYYLVTRDNKARQRVDQFEMQEEDLTWDGDDDDVDLDEPENKENLTDEDIKQEGVREVAKETIPGSVSQVADLAAKLEAANREIERCMLEIAELKKYRDDNMQPVTLQEVSDGVTLKKEIEDLNAELAHQKAENEVLRNKLAVYERSKSTDSTSKQDNPGENRDDSKWSDEKEVYTKDTSHPEWEADGWSEWE